MCDTRQKPLFRLGQEDGAVELPGVGIGHILPPQSVIVMADETSMI